MICAGFCGKLLGLRFYEGEESFLRFGDEKV